MWRFGEGWNVFYAGQEYSINISGFRDALLKNSKSQFPNPKKTQIPNSKLQKEEMLGAVEDWGKAHGKIAISAQKNPLVGASADFWNLNAGICDFFVIWELGFGISGRRSGRPA